MSRPFVHVRRLAGAAALVAAACSYPTDSSAGAWVTIDAPPVLIRGNDTLLVAHVYVLQHGTDTVEVKNVEVTWTSADTKLATVAALPGRMARVTGVKPGIDAITAVAAALQSAQSATLMLRVANPFEMDSVRPLSVRYGDSLTVYGVGAENADVLLLGTQQLILNSFSGVADNATGSGRRRFWVEFPAKGADSVTGIGNAVVATAHDTIAVDITQDQFDPNSTAPAVINIDGHPFKSDSTTVSDSFGTVAFYNPALFAEDPLAAPYKVDWFRFATLKPDTAYTFIYVAPGLFGREATFLTAPVTAATISNGSWSYGSGHYNCKGYSFVAAEAPNAGFQAAFTRLPPGGVDLVSLFADRGAYQLGVLHGYATAARLHADRFEGNNTCDLADSNFVKTTLRIDLTTPFSDTLTIDNAFEIDWLRFHVPGTGPQTVTAKLFSRSVTQPTVNPSDIVLYVLNIPSPMSPLTILRSALTGGASKTLTLTLNPGDYYLVAHDSVGFPARYSLCIAVGTTCALPALPALSVQSPRAERRAPRPAFAFESALAGARKRRPPR